jgi:hypothetical protein
MCESVPPIRHLLAPLAASRRSRFGAANTQLHLLNMSCAFKLLLFPVLQPLRDFLTIDILDPCACLI